MRNRLIFSVLLPSALALGMIVPTPLTGAESGPGPLVGPVSIRSDQAKDVNKFLFIISVSNEMEKMPYGGRQTLFDLIHSGISDYMRAGDTFGVWTFHSKLNAGDYPMQVWSPSNTVDLASRATLFVEKHNYRSRSDLDEVMAGVMNVIQAVEDANIFIISDYKVRIKGTPFDDEVNNIYKERHEESHHENRPFITTILARGKSITTAGVTLAGEPITLPTRPPLLPESEIGVTEKVAASKPHPPRSASENHKSEIIISKSGTVTKRTPLGIMISGPRPDGEFPISQPELDKLQSNSSFLISPEFERALPAPLALPQVDKTPGETSLKAPPPAIQPVPKVAATSLAQPLSVPDPLRPAEQAEMNPGESSVAGSPSVVAAAEASQPEPTAENALEKDPAEKKTNESHLLANLKDQPIVVSARERSEVQTRTDQLGMPGTSMAAMASPVKQGSSSAFWFYAGGAGLLLVFVMGLVYWLAQRRSDTSHTSYITKSMYRK